MNRWQAACTGLAKRIAGWVIFILAAVSTLISMLKYIDAWPINPQDFSGVIMDFARLMIHMLQETLPWLSLFWQHSPVPDFHGHLNLSFWIIYLLIFIGMALNASGRRINRRLRYLREHVEDQVILEQAKGEQGLSRTELESRINVPNHSIFRQFFTLYISPIIVIIVAYLVLSLFKLI